MTAPFVVFVILCFSVLGVSLFAVQIWSNLKPRDKAAARETSERASDLAAAE